MIDAKKIYSDFREEVRRGSDKQRIGINTRMFSNPISLVVKAIFFYCNKIT
jgi:hypothetical protein